MALTVTSRGTGTHNTSATTLVPGGRSATLAVGSMGVLCIAVDNAGSAGSAVCAPTSWTDAKSNVWTRRTNALYDNGAASAGIEMAFYTAPITTALLTGDAGTMTWISGVSPTAKVWTWYEVIPGANKVVGYNTGAAGTGATAANAQQTTASITIGDAVIAGYFSENVNAVTGDSDTTNGTWTAQQTTTIGSGTSGVIIATQQKVQTTANSTQSYDVTVASQDRIAGYIAFNELPDNRTYTVGLLALITTLPAPTLVRADKYTVPVKTLVVTGFAPRLTAPTLYNEIVLDDGAVGYWRLGEPSGTTVNDETTNNLDGTYYNTPTLGVTGALSGDSNTAVTFASATAEMANIPDNAALDLGDGPMSFEFWFKRARTAVTEVLLSQYGGVADQVTIRFDGATDKIELYAPDSVTTVATTSGAITDTNWHYFVATKNGATSKIYLDGTDVTTAGINVTFVSGNRGVDFAAENSGSTFNGSMDEVALYNIVLTSTQVTAHYNAGVSAGSQTKTIPTLALVTTLPAPSLVRADKYTVPVATLVVTGLAPTLNIGTILTVPVLNLPTTPFAPTLVRADKYTVPVLNLPTAAFAPTLVRADKYTVPVATLVVTGLAPSLSFGTILTIPVLNLPTAPFAPSLVRADKYTVPVTSLVVTGLAPSLSFGTVLAVPLLNLPTAAFAPSLVRADTYAVPLLALVVTGLAPSLSFGTVLAVPLLALAVTGLAPTVDITAGSNITLTIPLATLVTTPFAPSLIAGTVLSVPLATLTIGLFAPSLSFGTVLSVPLATLTTALFAPSLSFGTVLSVPLATLATATFAPSLIAGTVLSVPLATLTTVLFAPSLIRADLYTVPLATLVTATFAPSLIAGTVLSVPLATLTTALFAPSLIRADLYTVPLATLVLNTFAPSLGSNDIRIVPLATLVTAMFAPALVRADLYTIPLATLVIAPFAPDLIRADKYTVPLATLTAAPFAPSLIFGGYYSIPVATLVTTPFAVSLGLTAHQYFEVPFLSLSLSTYAPGPPLFDFSGQRREALAAGIVMQEFFPRRRVNRDHRAL